MNRRLKTGAAALMLSCMAGNFCVTTAQAASCANPEDIHAVQTAAVQQRLMVAALSCHATESYNHFVLNYRTELQASDRQLQNFFHRMYGQSGESSYHSFKTKLANASSMESIKDPSYCANAEATFDAALNQGRKSLMVFISSQPTSAEREFSACEIVTASSRRK